MRFSCLLFLLITACNAPGPPGTYREDWTMTGFQRVQENPVLTPGGRVFTCPIRQAVVAWEVKDVFNPAAVVRGDTLMMLYRAEDTVGVHAGTSRIGLAWSLDGAHFEHFAEPVLYPDNDSMAQYEWEGGIEDPRVVETQDGRYLMTYTAYDGKTARLCVAGSEDLRHWTKHGLVFRDFKYRDTWAKSGAIVCRREGDRLIAVQLNGKYWMYWGDTEIFAAHSSDLQSWTPVEDEQGRLLPVFGPREGMFDSQLVEPGPPALLTDYGILLLYNSRNLDTGGDPALAPGTYTAGQILLDPGNPLQILARTERYFFRPEMDYEITGQVGNVVFLEALVPFKGRWFLYYGTADSKIAAAVAE